jgi:hypothetical protein
MTPSEKNRTTGKNHLLRIDQLIFSDLVISAYGFSKSPLPCAAAPALVSLAEWPLLPRAPLPPGLELLALDGPFAGVRGREAACEEEAPLFVSLIFVIGFFTDGGGGGGGGAPGGKAGLALNVCRNGPDACAGTG